MKSDSQWIDAALLRHFEAEGTDAHRLCTIEDGWVQRFGADVLISFKRVLARERLIEELQSWAKTVGFDVGRIFARFVPRKNEERESPRLILGDPAESLQTIATERHLKFGIDFGVGYSVGFFIDQRENRRRVRRLRRSDHSQYRSLQKISGAGAGEFCAEQPANRRPSVHRGRCDGGVAATCSPG